MSMSSINIHRFSMSTFGMGMLKLGPYLSVYTLALLHDLTGFVLLMQLCYFVMVLIAIGLVFGFFNGGGINEEAFLLTSLMLFILSTQEQRFYLLVVLIPQLYSLSSIYLANPKYSLQFGGGSNQSKMVTCGLRAISRMAALFMIMLVFQAYIFMGGEFNMNVDVRAGNVGLVNMEDYPTFSGFLMVYHKLGYFFILITFLFRLTKSSTNNNNGDDENSTVVVDNQQQYTNNELRIYLFRFLGQKAIVMMWIFNLNFWQYKDYLDCFIMTLILSIVTVGFGFLLVVDIIRPKSTPLIIFKLKQKFLNNRSNSFVY
eukprot:gene5163-6428_t